MGRKKTTRQDSTGVHVWLVFMKAFQALLPHAARSIKRTELGDSDFRVLEALLHKGPLPVNTIGPKVWLTPGSISVAVDRLVKKGLVSRKDHPDDRRVRRVELTAKGRALINRGFGEHAAAMEDVADVLSKKERLILLRLLKKLGKPLTFRRTRPILLGTRLRIPCGCYAFAHQPDRRSSSQKSALPWRPGQLVHPSSMKPHNLSSSRRRKSSRPSTTPNC